MNNILNIFKSFSYIRKYFFKDLQTRHEKQFFSLLNNTYKITLNEYPDSIFYVWDKSIERQLKYNRLFNTNKIINYSFNKKDILFKQDLKNKKLWYDHSICKLLKIKEPSKSNYVKINKLIDEWLKNDTNWKLYLSRLYFFEELLEKKMDNKWKQYRK
jgi:hypothetical protein